MANIRDVARSAGVSTATVSHVLNGTRVVSEDVQRRVKQAASDLHYYPNYLARSLTTKRTGMVGMVVSDISNPFFGELFRGFEAMLRPHRYDVMLCSTEGNPAREEEVLRLLMARRVDGIAAAVTSQKWATLQAALASSFPLVFLDLRVEGVSGPLVCGDNELGAYLGVSHLIADGHRRIAMLTGPRSMSSMQDRLAGYARALAEGGISYEEGLVVHSRLAPDSAAQKTLELLDQSPRPTALFLGNNILTLGALNALQSRGLFCPEDIALVCFDDVPWSAIADPPLTVLHQPNYEMGSLAGSLLMRQIQGESVARSVITLKPELIVRQSCRADRHGALTRNTQHSCTSEVPVQGAAVGAPGAEVTSTTQAPP